MESRELYEVLGLQPFADGAMVDQAYWHLAKSFQTLAVTDPRARQALDELNDAYGVLGTPRLREEYDLTLAGDRGASTEAVAPAARQKPKSTRRGFSFASLFRSRTNEHATVATMITTPPTTPEVETNPAASGPRAGRRSKSDVQDLQASTGEMLKRWRANAGIEAKTTALEGHPIPDSTLVDIFRSEEAIADEQDPLNAVMDVLRSSKETAASRP